MLCSEQCLGRPEHPGNLTKCICLTDALVRPCCCQEVPGHSASSHRLRYLLAPKRAKLHLRVCSLAANLVWWGEKHHTDKPVVLTYGHLSRDLVKPSINSPSPGTAGAGLSHCWSHSRYTGTRNIPLLTALASSALAAQAHTCVQNPCSTAGPQTCVFQMLLFAELNAALLGWTAFSSVLVLHF